jgi:hypothetical protein
MERMIESVREPALKGDAVVRVKAAGVASGLGTIFGQTHLPPDRRPRCRWPRSTANTRQSASTAIGWRKTWPNSARRSRTHRSRRIRVSRDSIFPPPGDGRHGHCTLRSHRPSEPFCVSPRRAQANGSHGSIPIDRRVGSPMSIGCGTYSRLAARNATTRNLGSDEFPVS